MKTEKKKVFLMTAVVLAMCLSLSSCLSIVGNIIDNLDAVFNFVQGFGSEKLPENTVYGSENPLAVGFSDGKLTAFWDEKDNEEYSVSVMGSDGITTVYTPQKNADLFRGCSFDLEGAEMNHYDSFIVQLKRTDIRTNTYTTDKVKFDGVGTSDYLTYSVNVPGGFRTIDYYIATRYELFEFFNYMLIFRPGVKQVADNTGSYYQIEANVKLAYDFEGLYGGAVSAEKAFEAEVMCAVASFEDSAAYNYAYRLGENNVGYFLVKFYYDVNPVHISDSNTLYSNATTFTERAHYTLEQEERAFPVDSLQYGVTVSSSDQLYFAIKKGYRPLPVAGSNAALLYERMRYILSLINEDNDNQPRKIHNIYDYIVDTVVYDYRFVDVILEDESVDDNEFFRYKCLYMEGVFGLRSDGTFAENERVAICDGLSKAFLCMTRIEGINSLKISGASDGGAHAWNKVQVGSKWYLVDTTWGNSLDRDREYLNHNYLMVPDDSRHIEDKWFSYPKATGRYNFVFG